MMRITFKGIEEMMIRNIANSLFQLYFHQTATPEELKEYYGWEEDFEEDERAKLVDDTVKRLKAEQLVLRFYKKNITALNTKYDSKDATGDFDLPPERPTGNSGEPGSISPDARGDGEGRPEQSTGGDTGHGDTNAESRDGGHETQGDEDQPTPGPSTTDDTGGHDSGGKE